MTIYTHHVEGIHNPIAHQQPQELMIEPPQHFEGPKHREAVLAGANIVARLIDSEERGKLDPNTNLANKRGFDEALEALLAKVEGEEEPQVALVYFDLDRFKAVNDYYGHDVGDDTLFAFADLLRKNIHAREQEGEIVARLGGDEFVAVIKTVNSLQDDDQNRRLNMTDEEIIQGFEDRIIKQVQQLAIDLGITNVNLGVSFGVVKFREKGHEKETAFEFKKRADTQMYENKTINKAMDEIRDTGYAPSDMLKTAEFPVELSGQSWIVSDTNNLQPKLEAYFGGKLLNPEVVRFKKLFDEFKLSAVGKRLERILDAGNKLTDAYYDPKSPDTIEQRQQKREDWKHKTANERAVLLTFAFTQLETKLRASGDIDPMELVK